MKNNTPPTSEPVAPLIWKLTLIGGGILIMVLLVLTVRSIIGIFRPSPSLTSAAQANTIIVAVQPVETPQLSAPDNVKPAVSLSNQPVPFAVQAEIMRQREQARAATIEELIREAQEQAGTSGVPKEVLQKLEQSDSYIQ